MLQIKSRKFCEIVENHINKSIKHPNYIMPFECWQTEDNKCLLPFYDMVEIYENENELIEKNAYKN